MPGYDEPQRRCTFKEASSHCLLAVALSECGSHRRMHREMRLHTEARCVETIFGSGFGKSSFWWSFTDRIRSISSAKMILVKSTENQLKSADLCFISADISWWIFTWVVADSRNPNLHTFEFMVAKFDLVNFRKQVGMVTKFTSIYSHLDWIRNQVNESLCWTHEHSHRRWLVLTWVH